MFAEIIFYEMNFRVDYFLTDYTTFRQIRENLHRQIFLFSYPQILFIFPSANINPHKFFVEVFLAWFQF